MTLNRFLSQSDNKCLLFFWALKNPKDFLWTEKCPEVFEKLKHHLAQLSWLSSSILDEALSLYLTTTN